MKRSIGASDFQKFVLTALSRGGMRYQKGVIGISTCLHPVKLSAPTAKFRCKIQIISANYLQNLSRKKIKNN